MWEERCENGDHRPFFTPHKNTVYRRLKRYTRLELVIGREGYQAAQKAFSPTQHGVRALKPGELIELDFWKGDVFTLSKKSDFWDLLTPDLQKLLQDGKKTGRKSTRQRLWVCIAMDVATRMILGASIAEAPNARTVLDVLDMVMRDKSSVSELAECRLPWFQHCGLGTIVIDTGGEFFDENVQNAILTAGGSFIYGRTGVPMDKPFVERFFGGLRTLFADEIPGKTGYSPDCLVGYDREGMAIFNADQFRLVLIRHLVDFYPLREHRGLLGKRPIDAWKDAQKYGVVRPPQPRTRRHATGLRLRRTFSKEGIGICAIPFGNPELFPKSIRNGKFEVEVRLDPNDLREITAVIGDEPIYLENQRPDLAHHSIRTWMAAIKKMTETRPQDRVFYEHVLRSHADWFSDRIERGIADHGLPSVEVRREEIEWFENNFCLKLEITRNPEQLHSADIETLLNDGAGAGICTAKQVAEEQSSVRPDTEDFGALQLDMNFEETEVAAPFEQTEVGVENEADPDHDISNKTSRFTGKPKGKGRFK